MTVDSATVVILLQPSFNIFESFEILLKLFLSRGGRVLIISNTKKKEIILIQFIEVHSSSSGECNLVGSRAGRN